MRAALETEGELNFGLSVRESFLEEMNPKLEKPKVAGDDREGKGAQGTAYAKSEQNAFRNGSRDAVQGSGSIQDRAGEFSKSQVPVDREFRLHLEKAGAMEGVRE